nr:hypothetical protein CFP56_30082 [Quercus suber]
MFGGAANSLQYGASRSCDSLQTSKKDAVRNPVQLESKYSSLVTHVFQEDNSWCLSTIHERIPTENQLSHGFESKGRYSVVSTLANMRDTQLLKVPVSDLFSCVMLSHTTTICCLAIYISLLRGFCRHVKRSIRPRIRPKE